MNIVHYNYSGFTSDIQQHDAAVVVAIDSSLVSVHSLELPRMSRSKFKSAIAFKLEEMVLADIEQLEFIPIKQDQSNHWDVMVIAKSILVDVKKTLIDACVQPLCIVPEFMLLPRHSGKVSYLELNNQVLYRSTKHQGGKLTKPIFAQIFTDTQQLYKVERFSEAIPTLSLIHKSEFSLWKSYLLPWRYSAVAATIVLALFVAQLSNNSEQLANELQRLNQSNQAQFKQTFPTVKKVVDVHTQATQKLALAHQHKQSLSNDFLTALNKKITPGKQLSKINYKDQLLTIKEIK